MTIRNLEQLLSKGNIQGRRVVLDVIQHALREVDFYSIIGNFVRLDDDLWIGETRYDLDKIEDIFVVGGGKQVTFVAAALEELLQDRISEGIVVEKRGWGRSTERIAVVEGGHPIPDLGSVEGATGILRLAEKAREGDLVIVCVTGGCTSLTTLPPSEISLEEVVEVFNLLLVSGAPIEEVNTVRKHLSQL
ncbi:glycerate-2-kinase family protein, partial [[Eubacterium] cellulosolvens]